MSNTDNQIHKVSSLDDEDKLDLIGQTAKIPWLELQRFFAAGKVIEVKAPLNLVTVGLALQKDDTGSFERWLAEEAVLPVSDSLATELVDTQASVWALAVSPWVLVQKVRKD